MQKFEFSEKVLAHLDNEFRKIASESRLIESKCTLLSWNFINKYAA